MVGPSGQATDLSAYRGVRFYARSKDATAFSAGIVRFPGQIKRYAAPFEVRPEWTLVELPFEKFRVVNPPGATTVDTSPLDPKDITSIGVGVAPAAARAIRARHRSHGVLSVSAQTMRVGTHACVVAAFWAIVSVAASGQTPMRKLQLLPASPLASLSWVSLASDPKGDGLQPRLPDAKDLSYAIDSAGDLVWFSVTVYDPLPERWFGFSVTVDNDDRPDNGMTWWGTNKIKFDRLASAFLFNADDYWQGYAGVGDSESIGRGNMTNLTGDVRVALDRERRAIFLGVPRSALGPAPAVRVIATVGSMLVNNDDVPNEGVVTVRLR